MLRRDLSRGIGGGWADTAAGPHFAPKAKRVIFLFLNGGMSHVDTFDPKPILDKHGLGFLETEQLLGPVRASIAGLQRIHGGEVKPC